MVRNGTPWALAVAAVALAGCTSLLDRYYDGKRVDQFVQFEPEPLYCYRTLGQVDCHASPLQPRSHGRIVSYYGPIPTAPPRAPNLSSQSGQGPRVLRSEYFAPIPVPREEVETEPLPVPAPSVVRSSDN
jgi:hypothetical protein